MQANIESINREIAYLKKAVEQIQGYIEDSSLTAEEEEIVEEGRKEYREGKCISIEALKKRYA